ncbi:MAG: hypothetical protein ABJC04_01285 [Verrucomicrobiota bacterium]
MKRFALFLFLFAAMTCLPVLAQDSGTASAIADRQVAEERYKRMSADMESMMAANLVLQKKVSTLEAELQKVREDVVRVSANDTSKENLKRLADAVQEVDKKREADKQLILEKISDLRKVLASAPSPTPRSSAKISVPDDSSAGPQKGFEYVVQSRDTLLGITSEYNAAFKSKGMKTITPKQVRDNNPNVVWEKLKIGQKIFIPAPGE